jgi:hypothetical protein
MQLFVCNGSQHCYNLQHKLTQSTIKGNKKVKTHTPEFMRLDDGMIKLGTRYHANRHQQTCLIIIDHLALSLLDASPFGLVLFQSQGGVPRGCMLLSN